MAEMVLATYDLRFAFTVDGNEESLLQLKKYVLNMPGLHILDVCADAIQSGSLAFSVVKCRYTWEQVQ